MSRFVLDNSVAMRWFMPSTKKQDQAYARAVLSSFSSATALVPNFWHLEAVNALLGGERREEISQGQVESYLVKLDKLPIFVDPLTVHNSFGRILSLARVFNLSSYDAAYLELAIRESLPLATLDQKLQKASVKSGVSLYIMA